MENMDPLMVMAWNGTGQMKLVYVQIGVDIMLSAVFLNIRKKGTCVSFIRNVHQMGTQYLTISCTRKVSILHNVVKLKNSCKK